MLVREVPKSGFVLSVPLELKTACFCEWRSLTLQLVLFNVFPLLSQCVPHCHAHHRTLYGHLGIHASRCSSGHASSFAGKDELIEPLL